MAATMLVASRAWTRACAAQLRSACAQGVAKRSDFAALRCRPARVYTRGHHVRIHALQRGLDSLGSAAVLEPVVND